MTSPNPSYRIIPLTQGQFAIVDAADYEWLVQWKWHAAWCECTRSFYAKRTEKRVNGKQKTIRMHREILGLMFGHQSKGDHWNHNTLDNRRDNLRPADSAQSSQNRKIRTDNTSGYKGVTWHKRLKKWQVRVSIKGKRHHLGYYDDIVEAYKVYCEAAKKYHGEFACLG